MARPKKTTPKATARKATEGKAAASKGRQAVMKMLKGAAATKRPPSNPEVPQLTIEQLNEELNGVKEVLEDFAQHLRSLDRMRLNGVGIKKLGFIERAYELALENAEYLPHYVTIERFGNDLEYFMDFRSLTDLVNQIKEQMWNITIQSADIAYTDALEFYSSVREAAKRRVDSAETLYHALFPFFKKMGMRTEDEEAQPTKKKMLRDFKALDSGKHDGVLVIENRSPKLTGGKRKVIDESFKDSAEFKENEQGEISE